MIAVLRSLLGAVSGKKKIQLKNWTSDMHAAYRVITRRVVRVGMELEYIFGPNTHVDISPNLGKNTYNGLVHTGYKTSFPIGREFELVQLFPVAKPTDLTSSIIRFCKRMIELQVNTMGSVHLSSLARITPSDQQLLTACVGIRYSNLETDFVCSNSDKRDLYYRYECKFFAGFLLPEDLLAQVLLFAFSFQVKEKSEYQEFLSLVIQAREESTTASKRWATIDLNTVLFD
jgi:hypothetical protein